MNKQSSSSVVETPMDMLSRDLDVLIDDINGMLAHYQISDWETYVFFRKRGCPQSYVLKYEAAAGDDFAAKIARLHQEDASGATR